MSDLIDDPLPGQNAPEFTVSEISGAVKRVIEGEFGRIRVRGEVGRVFKARSGHLYYDIKDDRNVLACTTWKGQVASLSVMPEEGLEVVVTGRMTTFGAQSKYNLNVDEVSVAGAGALMAMLEKRKKALEAEGLFDPSRKRPLPYLPEVIGVVTSPSGAVIRDILHRLRDRFPRKVLIWPVAVQGAGCAPEVARAIEGFNALAPGGPLPRPDLLIVARGGGSIEDLWGFNEEIVVRAAAASEIPLISAVGHETDTTLIDFAADKRAPTPTAAAEMAVPVRVDLMAWLSQQGARISGHAARGLEIRGQRLRDLARALPRKETLLEAPRQRLDMADRALNASLRANTDASRTRFERAGAAIRPAALQARVRKDRERLEAVSNRLAPAMTRLLRDRTRETTERRARVVDVWSRAERALDRLRTRKSDALAALERLRLTLGYEETLARGYAVVWGDGVLVTQVAAAKAADTLEIQFKDGRMTAGRGGSAPPRPARKPPDQGSLF